jgi:hypothetical protein
LGAVDHAHVCTHILLFCTLVVSDFIPSSSLNASACHFMLLYTPSSQDTSYHCHAKLVNWFLYHQAITSSVNANTHLLTAFVEVRFGIVFAYNCISWSVNTHTSPYTHLAKLGISHVNCALSICASVS